MKFFDSVHCKSRSHCKACRGDAAWRESIFKAGLTEAKDFDCPHGFTSDKLPIRGLGDLVAKVAQPIAGMIDSVAGTNLKNCGGCKGRREALNKIKL
jgi:hypothetical protein